MQRSNALDNESHMSRCEKCDKKCSVKLGDYLEVRYLDKHIEKGHRHLQNSSACKSLTKLTSR